MSRSPRSARAPIAWLATCAVSLLAARALPAAPLAGATPRVVLTSPADGGRWVRPETSLLMRFDPPLSSAGGGVGAPRVNVVGSLTGEHDGRSVVADGGHALIFHPARPFSLGETVVVDVGDAATSGSAEPFRFEFSTSVAPAPQPSPAERIAAELDDPAALAIARATLPTTAPQSPAPAWTPPSLTSLPGHVADGPHDGLLYLAAFAGPVPYLEIMNDAGYAAFYRGMPFTCFDFKLQPNGLFSYYDGGSGKFMLMDSTYTVIDSVTCGNGYLTDVHDLRILPNGHMLLIGGDVQTVDMSQLVPGGNPAAAVSENVIQELDPFQNVVFEWRSFDHFAITDATHEDLTAATIDYVHANSLDLDADGNILLSSRHLDEVTKIDRATGNILWRLGGKNNQFALSGDNQWFSHQHAARRIANGNITLFDNGNFRVPQVSRAEEYALDEVAKTATLVWQFRNVPDSYGFAMGYVERLDDGATLVSYGTGSPDAVQVAADGTVTQVVNLPASYVSYRIIRDHSGSLVGVPPLPSPRVALSESIPNPSRHESSMYLTLARPGPVTFQVFDVRGRRVLDLLDRAPYAAGVYRLPVDLSNAPAGVYLARVTTSEGTVNQRIVHLD